MKTRPFQIDRSLMMGEPHIARNDADLFDENMVQKKRYDFDESVEQAGDGDDEEDAPTSLQGCS